MNTTREGFFRAAFPAGFLITPALLYPWPLTDLSRGTLAYTVFTSAAVIIVFLAALVHTPGSYRPPTCLTGLLTIGTTSLIIWHHINDVLESCGTDDKTAVLGPAALIGITIVLVLNYRNRTDSPTGRAATSAQPRVSPSDPGST